jgi:MFS family permease
MQERDEEAFRALSKLRRLPADYPDLVAEALDIKASIIVENQYVKENFAGKTGFGLHAAQVNYRMSICSSRKRELTIYQ